MFVSIRSRPHSVLEMESEGRRLLLGTWSLEVFTFASPIFFGACHGEISLCLVGYMLVPRRLQAIKWRNL